MTLNALNADQVQAHKVQVYVNNVYLRLSAAIHFRRRISTLKLSGRQLPPTIQVLKKGKCFFFVRKLFATLFAFSYKISHTNSV